MGCDESKDVNYPVLIGFFETGREDQKAYCIKLTENFKHEQSIKYQISSPPGEPFSIQFKVKGQSVPFKIQETFNSSDEAMNEALEKIYNILNEKK